MPDSVDEYKHLVAEKSNRIDQKCVTVQNAESVIKEAIGSTRVLLFFAEDV